MTEETKRRGRPPKSLTSDGLNAEQLAETTQAITDFDGPSEESFSADLDALAGTPEPIAVAGVEPGQPLTFADVMAWNRVNAHLVAPQIDLPKKQRPKAKRI